METPCILLMTEGTYPCHSGGVSVWCDKLVHGLPEADFHVLALTSSPNLRYQFPIPDNVVSMRLLPLWGTEEPGAEQALFSETYRKKMRTSRTVIRSRFLEPFETAVRGLIARGAASEGLATALVELYQYFREYDYARSVSSPEAWDTFLRVCARWPDENHPLSLNEATHCMRWMQRYLAVLSVDYPEVDIAHASMSGLAAVPGVILKKLHGTRFLLTEHGVYLRELYIALGSSNYTANCRTFLLALNESVIRMNYHFADAVTTLCDFNRKWQVQLGADPTKIWSAPNGVDEEVFSPKARKCGEDPVVLTLSRIMPLKGVQVLLKAAILVRERVPRVRFRILGEPIQSEYTDQCMRIIAENHLDDIIELGHTNDPASAYRTADLYCLPSISEAMPYSVIESMLSGCPVVATDVGGISELLGGTGLLVKPNDPESLADGLISLLDGLDASARRNRLAFAALSRARKHYTLRQCIARFRRIYRELGAQMKTPYAITEMPEPGHRELTLVASR